MKRPTKREHHASILANYAESRGYCYEEELDRVALAGLAPAVVQTNRRRGRPRYLFLGAVTEAASDPSDRPATARRFKRYLRAFAALLTRGSVDGGEFAVIADDPKVAAAWAEALNAWASAAGLAGGDGEPPDFEVIKIDRTRGWIIAW